MSSPEHVLMLGNLRAASLIRHAAGVSTDEELMEAFGYSLDDKCFEGIADRYGPRAWRVAAALLGSGTDAEDAVQEAFLRVIRGRATYRRGASFRNWFFAILRNVCRDMLRRPAETDAFDDETVAAAAGPDPAAPLVLREQSRAAWCALQDLPAHEREVLALRLYAELDFAEIAKSCGISQIAARQRASRGLGRLRRRLTDGLAASAIPVGASLEAQPGGPKA